jgi:replicative DNA helicase
MDGAGFVKGRIGRFGRRYAAVDANELNPSLTGGHPLPQNIDAEAAVLAAAILSSETVPDIAAQLSPDDFYRPSHRTVYSAILELYRRDIPIDQVSLADYLDAAGQLNMVGGKPFIIDLASNSFALVNWRAHAKIVRRCAILRQLIAASTNITALAFDAPPEDVEAIVQQSEAMLFSVTNKEVENASRPLGEFVAQAFTEIQSIAEAGGHIAGVATGFRDLDKVLLGMRAGSLNIVGARPGVGKTSFALSLALNAARTGTSVVFFSLEMSGEEVATRLLCAEAGVSNEDVRSGNIAEDMWGNLLEAADRLSKLDFMIDDTAGTNVVEIRTKARRMLHGKPNGLVIVDYLQLINPARRSENRNVEVGEMSRALKVLAKELRVPVIALAQLSRDIERRPDKRPVLADLRDSGSIEQDADTVMFLDRSTSEEEANDEKHNRPPLGQANVVVAKNRAGRSGVDVPIAWIPSRTLFRDLSRTEG